MMLLPPLLLLLLTHVAVNALSFQHYTVADSYLLSSHGTYNYGGWDECRCSESSALRRPVLMFALSAHGYSDAAARLATAHLSLSAATYSASGTFRVDVHSMSHEYKWTEGNEYSDVHPNGVTWSAFNHDSVGGLVGSADATSSRQMISADITEYVRQALETDESLLSVQLRCPDSTVFESQLVDIYTKEYATPSQRPVLTLDFSGFVPSTSPVAATLLADTYIYKGRTTYNYGESDVMRCSVHYSSNQYENRNPMLRFDLPSLHASDVATATLAISGAAVSTTGSYAVDVYGLTGAWIEGDAHQLPPTDGGVTWDSFTATPEELITTTYMTTSPARRELDVTRWVRHALAEGETEVAFYMECPEAYSDGTVVQLYSKESTGDAATLTLDVPSGTRSATHSATVPPSMHARLLADTYLFSGQTTYNYGARPDAGCSEDSGSRRRTLLKFSLPSYNPGMLVDATLQWSAATQVSTGEYRVDVRSVSDTSWVEGDKLESSPQGAGGVTWGDFEDGTVGSVLGFAYASEEVRRLSVDVSDYVRSQMLAGAAAVSFQHRCESSTSSNSDVRMRTKENSNQPAPALVLNLIPPTSPMTAPPSCNDLSAITNTAWKTTGGSCDGLSSLDHDQTCSLRCSYGLDISFGCTAGSLSQNTCPSPKDCATPAAVDYPHADVSGCGVMTGDLSQTCTAPCRFSGPDNIDITCNNGNLSGGPCRVPTDCTGVLSTAQDQFVYADNRDCTDTMSGDDGACSYDCRYETRTGAVACVDGTTTADPFVCATPNTCDSLDYAMAQDYVDSSTNCTNGADGDASSCSIDCRYDGSSLDVECVNGVDSHTGTCPVPPDLDLSVSFASGINADPLSISINDTTSTLIPWSLTPGQTDVKQFPQDSPIQLSIDVPQHQTCAVSGDAKSYFDAVLPIPFLAAATASVTCNGVCSTQSDVVFQGAAMVTTQPGDVQGCCDECTADTNCVGYSFTSADCVKFTSIDLHSTSPGVTSGCARGLEGVLCGNTYAPTAIYTESVTKSETVVPTALETPPAANISVTITADNIRYATTQTIRLQGSATWPFHESALSRLQYLWTEPAAKIPLTSSTPGLQTALTKQNLVLSAADLIAGQSYRFRLTATDPVTGQSQWGEISVYVLQGPDVTGLEAVNTTPDEAFFPVYNLTALAAARVPEAEPLAYVFKYFVTSSARRRLLSVVPANAIVLTPRQSNPSAQVVLDTGAITVVVVVEDAFGAVTTFTEDIVVTMPEPSTPSPNEPDATPAPCTADVQVKAQLDAVRGNQAQTLQLLLLGSRLANSGELCGNERDVLVYMWERLEETWDPTESHSGEIIQTQQLSQTLAELTTRSEWLTFQQVFVALNDTASVFDIAEELQAAGNTDLGITFTATIGVVLSNILDANLNRDSTDFCTMVKSVQRNLQRLFASDMGPILAGQSPIYLEADNIAGAGAKITGQEKEVSMAGDSALPFTVTLPATASDLSLTIVTMAGVGVCYPSGQGTVVGDVTIIEGDGNSTNADGFEIVFPLNYNASLVDNGNGAVTQRTLDDGSCVDVTTTDDVQCRWWNDTSDLWQTDGCQSYANLTELEESSTTGWTRGNLTEQEGVLWCRCTHLTEFAVIKYRLETSQTASCGGLLGEVLFLVFSIIYAIVFVMAFTQSIRIIRSTNGFSLTMLLGEHVLITFISVFRMVYCLILATVADISAGLLIVFGAAPSAFNYWAFSLVICTWAGIYHFTMKTQGGSFQGVKKAFITVNTLVTVVVASVFVAMGFLDGDALDTVSTVGDMILATVSMCTGLGFIIYGTLLIRKIKGIQVGLSKDSTTKTSSQSSIRRLFKVASVLSLVFMIEAAILVVITINDDLFLENFDLLQGLYLGFDVLALCTILLMFSRLVTDKINEKARQSKPDSATLSHSTPTPQLTYNSHFSNSDAGASRTSLASPPSRTEMAPLAGGRSSSTYSMGGDSPAYPPPPSPEEDEAAILRQELARQRNSVGVAQQGFGSEADILKQELARQRQAVGAIDEQTEMVALRAELERQRQQVNSQ